MPLPKKDKKFIQEVVEPVVQEEEVVEEKEFLQEIKEPIHEEELVEQPKKKSRKKKTFGIF